METKQVEAYGWVKDGKLTLHNQKAFYQDISELGDSSVSIIVKRTKNPTRSDRMNRYYHGVVVGTIRKYFNDNYTFGMQVSKEDVHELLKNKFLPHKSALLDNEMFSLGVSTRSLSNQEFIEYWESIIVWAAQVLDLQIPYPSEDFSS